MKSKKRWIAPWAGSETKPALYHCVSRVVDRNFVLGSDEKEKFRMFMRMMENFSGCQVLSYCVMSNHFHILLEVPPFPKAGISDAELLRRLAVFYDAKFVKSVEDELVAARLEDRREGVIRGGSSERVTEIHGRFTKRMYDLSEFMKTLLQRFTRWFNRTHSRTGTLWEDRFKSVIVESGTAARTIAAYIDLNPIRGGITSEPADYRWSSYGEAVGGGTKGNGKKARQGLVRAIEDLEARSQHAEDDLPRRWKQASRRYRRLMGLALGRKNANSRTQISRVSKISKNDAEALESGENETILPELSIGKMLHCQIRYFTDGAVIGSKSFVNEAFAGARERFSEKRTSGARRMRGSGKAAREVLWAIRDLRVRVGIG